MAAQLVPAGSRLRLRSIGVLRWLAKLRDDGREGTAEAADAPHLAVQTSTPKIGKELRQNLTLEG